VDLSVSVEDKLFTSFYPQELLLSPIHHSLQLTTLSSQAAAVEEEDTLVVVVPEVLELVLDFL